MFGMLLHDKVKGTLYIVAGDDEIIPALLAINRLRRRFALNNIVGAYSLTQTTGNLKSLLIAACSSSDSFAVERA